jgi:vesicle-fusing ATPase
MCTVYSCCFIIRHDNTGRLAPGQIGASSSQRQWIGLSIAGDEVTISPMDIPPAEVVLDSLDLEVGFWKRGLEIAEQFSADEMAQSFIRAFNGQIFSLDQQLVFDFHGHNLKAGVKGLSVLELADGQQKRRGSTQSISHMGVLMDRTDVVFIKAADSRIKIKSSNKKCVSKACGGT